LITKQENQILVNLNGDIISNAYNTDFEDYRCQILSLNLDQISSYYRRGFSSVFTINYFESSLYLENANEKWQWKIIRAAFGKYRSAMGAAWRERNNTCDSCFAEAVFDGIAD